MPRPPNRISRIQDARQVPASGPDGSGTDPVWPVASGQLASVAADFGGGVMAKRHQRPSAQYRYEHYDPYTQSNAGACK